jgi:ribonuclease PH
LRAVIDLSKLDGYTAIVDCDVIQADGGTRSAAITGASVALYLAFDRYLHKGIIKQNPMNELIAAVSVGIINNEIIVDLNYDQDSQAQVDMNIVMTESGKFVEIQGTGEEATFSKAQLDEMLIKAEKAIKSILEYEIVIINNYKP